MQLFQFINRCKMARNSSNFDRLFEAFNLKMQPETKAIPVYYVNNFVHEICLENVKLSGFRCILENRDWLLDKPLHTDKSATALLGDVAKRFKKALNYAESLGISCLTDDIRVLNIPPAEMSALWILKDNQDIFIEFSSEGVHLNKNFVTKGKERATENKVKRQSFYFYGKSNALPLLQ